VHQVSKVLSLSHNLEASQIEWKVQGVYLGSLRAIIKDLGWLKGNLGAAKENPQAGLQGEGKFVGWHDLSRAKRSTL
jgi:hypothetical protein